MTSSLQSPQSERDIRISKAQILRDIGINPYAQKFDKTSMIGDHTVKYEKKITDLTTNPFRDINDIIAFPTPTISIAGRLMLYRTHGKLSFGKLIDESGEIQVMWHKDACELIGKSNKIAILSRIMICFVREEDQKNFIQEKGNSFEITQKFKIVWECEMYCVSIKSGCGIEEHILQQISFDLKCFCIVKNKLTDEYQLFVSWQKNDLVLSSDTSEEILQKLFSSLYENTVSSFTNNINALLWYLYASPYKILEKYIDIGDFLGVRGELFYTHKGELTLFVSEWMLLSKAIRPLWDKFHGIGDDKENTYRQRYLDMIFNRDTLERMKLRSTFLFTVRQFYHQNGFIEIETPILGSSASGAAAAPFITYHKDFDLDMYLRISPETNLKKATVGMLEKVFEVAKDFRNEWSDPSHIQEFTMIEHYAAYRNHEDNMHFTEQMFDYLFDHIPQLKKIIPVADKNGIVHEINFQTPRQRIDYVSQIKKDSWIDVSQYSSGDEERLRNDILAAGYTRVGIEKQSITTMIDYLYKKVTRPKIVGPAFVVNYPAIMQPLARKSDTNPLIVEQRQLLINGREVIKAYSELVDPIQQQINFDVQSEAIVRGDEEAIRGDDDFVLAMEYGMPCQSGRGMGVDRILAILTSNGQPLNIRDVILFPLMKPIHDIGRHEKREGKYNTCLHDI